MTILVQVKFSDLARAELVKKVMMESTNPKIGEIIDLSSLEIGPGIKHDLVLAFMFNSDDELVASEFQSRFKNGFCDLFTI